MTLTQGKGEPQNRHSSPDSLHEQLIYQCVQQGGVKELRGTHVMWAVKSGHAAAELEARRGGRLESKEASTEEPVLRIQWTGCVCVALCA